MGETEAAASGVRVDRSLGSKLDAEETGRQVDLDQHLGNLVWALQCRTPSAREAVREAERSNGCSNRHFQRRRRSWPGRAVHKREGLQVSGVTRIQPRAERAEYGRDT